MRWIIKSLLEVILEALNGFFGFLSQPFLSNFALDIGAQLTTQGSSGAKESTDFSTAMTTIFQGQSFFDLAFPGMVKFCTALMILALMIVIMIMVLELLKAMTLGPGEAEHPLSIVGKSLMAGAGVGFSYAIFVMFEWTFNKIYLRFLATDVGEMETGSYFTNTLFTEKTIKESFDIGATGLSGTAADIVILLIALIALIMICIQFIKLLLSVLERYVLLGIFFYTSPLAFSTLASKNTSAIFKSWFRMVFSQFLLMIFGVFFINVFMMSMQNGMESLYNGTEANSGEMKYLCFIFALYAWLLIGQKVNSYLSEIGLSAAQSAGNLLGAVTGGAATIASGYLAARGAAKGMAMLDSKRTNPKTAAGQRLRDEAMLAKARHEEGQRTGRDISKDKADLTVAKESADVRQGKEDLGKNPNVFEERAQANSNKANQDVANDKARTKEGLNTEKGREESAKAAANREKMANANDKARTREGLNTEKGREESATAAVNREKIANANDKARGKAGLNTESAMSQQADISAAGEKSQIAAIGGYTSPSPGGKAGPDAFFDDRMKQETASVAHNAAVVDSRVAHGGGTPEAVRERAEVQVAQEMGSQDRFHDVGRSNKMSPSQAAYTEARHPELKRDEGGNWSELARKDRGGSKPGPKPVGSPESRANSFRDNGKGAVLAGTAARVGRAARKADDDAEKDKKS